MSMQVGEAGGEEDTPMSDINTTPLVDVMLVLLIIFLITVPVVLQSVPVELPKVEFEPTITKPENVNLSVRAVNGQCEVYWDLTRVNAEQLLSRAVAELEAQIAALGGDREHHRGEYARGAYPRRHQHALSLHRRRDLHHAARRLRPDRLHFRAAAARRHPAVTAASQE